MKIAFLNHYIAGGGAERVTCVLAGEMCKRGHNVILITDIFKPFAYTFDNRVKILPLYKEKKQFNNRILMDFYTIKNTRHILKTEFPDVLIGVQPQMNFAAIVASIGLNTKVIATDHTSFDRKLHFNIRFIRNYIYCFADAVTILTQADYNYLGRRLSNKVIMPNPLCFPCILNIDTNRKMNILAAGRLGVWYLKGFDLLIRAWSLIAKDYPEWTLDIAGGGSDKSKEQLYQIAQKYNVEKRINFLGFREDLDAVMRQSSIFALTSRVEGFGMVLIEAMSQGCACVSFDDGGRQREIIRNDKEGIIIERHDVSSLANAFRNLIEDENLRYTISKVSIQRASDFSIDNIYKKWDGLIKRVVFGKKYDD